MQYLAIFDGTTPLYVFCEDTQKLKAAPAGRWVDVNPVLLRELKKLLGEKNVAVRELERQSLVPNSAPIGIPS